MVFGDEVLSRSTEDVERQLERTADAAARAGDAAQIERMAGAALFYAWALGQSPQAPVSETVGPITRAGTQDEWRLATVTQLRGLERDRPFAGGVKAAIEWLTLDGPPV